MEAIRCLTCKNYQYANKCNAFEKIPNEIILGKNDHSKPFPGDHGIQYQPLDTEEAKE